jgi:hypothetical protein
MSDHKTVDGASHVMYVKEGDAFYAPPGTVVKHVPADRAAERIPTSGELKDRSEFEALFLKIHPGTQRMLFDRVVSDERYTSMEVEYACRVWMIVTNSVSLNSK